MDGIVTEVFIKKTAPFFAFKTSKFQKGTVHWVITPNRSAKIADGKIESTLPIDVFGAIGVFYLPDGAKRMNSMLTQNGVSTEQLRWILKDKRVLYELGESQGSEAYFVKDDWLPAGLKLKTREYRLSVFLPSRFPAPFPDILEILVDQKTVESSRTISVKENSTISESVFDLAVLRLTTVSKESR